MRESEEFIALRNQFGVNVKKFRLVRGLTQEELAFKSGLAYRHIQKIEAGQVNSTLLTITRLALSLGVSPWNLLAPSEDNQ